MAWLTGYKYRKQITIAGTVDGVKTNYTMKLTVYRSAGVDAPNVVYLGVGKCETDYDDLRFTTSDGATLLDYWIESSDAASAVVWIEFDSIPASPSTGTFFIYYGNAGAAAVSNGANTFPFFDDFSGTLTDKWSPNYSSNAGGICTVGDGVNAGALTGLTTFDQGYAYRTYAKCVATGSYNFLVEAACASGYARLGQYSAIHGSNFACQSDRIGSNVGDTGVAWNTNWYISEVQRFSASLLKVFFNGGQVLSTTTVNNIPTGAGALQFQNSAGKQTQVDWALVRKITTTEPTWSTWGAEENFILGGLSMSGCGR